LGGLFAAALLKVIVATDTYANTTSKSINGFPVLSQPWWKQCIIEFIGTFFLMTMVYMTCVDSRATENVHGMAIGGVVGFMLLASPAGAASAFNPARAFCPMLIDCWNIKEFKWVWIWIVFPILGALLAGLMCEWFLKEDNIDNKEEGAIELSVKKGNNVNMNATVDLDLGGDITTNLRETGTIDLDLEVPPTGGLSGNVEYPTATVDIELDADLDFEVEVELDPTVDWNAWGEAKDDQVVSWSGFFIQGGISNEMALDNMQIGFDGSISGTGEDAIGAFTITGAMNADRSFTFDKVYDAHTVSYKGEMEGTKLKGTWCLPEQDEEEFEISLNASGWVGNFVFDGTKTEMLLNMGISGGGVFGTGTDDVGGFVLRGTTDGEDFNFVKQYIGAHQVLYFGKRRGGEGSLLVKGKWTIPGNCDGTFALKQG